MINVIQDISYTKNNIYYISILPPPETKMSVVACTASYVSIVQIFACSWNQIIFVRTRRFYCRHLLLRGNKSQYWPRGAPKHAETAENEKA